MDSNLANGLAANSTHAVLGDSKSSKQAVKLAEGKSSVLLGTSAQQAACPSLRGEESTPTFQQALDKTLTAADTEPQVMPLKDNCASTQVEPRDGTAASLRSGIARSRKATPSTHPADVSIATQTPSAKRERRPVASQASPSGPQTQQTQTQDGPAKTDNKDPAPHRQDVAESDGTDPGAQIRQPTAWSEASTAISVSAVEVQASPKPTVAAELVADQGSKANGVGKTHVATDRPSADLQPAPGRPESQNDTPPETSESDLQTTSALKIDSSASVSGQAAARVTYAPRQASEATGQPQARGSAGNLRLEVSTQERDASGDATLGLTSTTSASGSAKVEGGTEGQRSPETARQIRLSGQATDTGSANPDGPSPAAPVYLSGQGPTLKDHLTAAGYDGPSATQTQIWPNASLSVESLTDLNNAIPRRIDESATANPMDGDRLSVQEQVVSSIRGAFETQTHQLSVELNPPELGKVLIHFEQQDHSVSGTLQVDNRATRAEIEQALPQIIQNLQDSGIQVKRLDVTLNDQYQQTFRDNAWADMYQGHSGQQDQGRPWPYAEQVDYLGNDPAMPSESTEAARPQVSIGANGSINLLV